MSSRTIKDVPSAGSEINLIKLDIVNHAGIRIDATNIFVELEIYENIFSNVMTGSLIIEDKYNFIKNAPLIGRETIEVIYKTPSTEEIKKTFSVTEIAASQRVPGKNESFVTFNFSSKQFSLDHSQKISKSYSSKKLTRIAELLFEEYLKTSDKDVLVAIQDSDPETTIVIPNWTPFQAINWIAKKASFNENCDYVFFESISCFFLVPLAFLKLQEPTTVFQYTPSSREDSTKPSVDEQLRRVQSYIEISDGFKKSEFETQGVFSSILEEFDTTYKDLEYKFFNYVEDFESAISMNKNPIGPLSYISSVKPENKIFVRSNSKYLHDGILQQSKINNVQKRTSQMHRVSDKVIKIDIPGDSRRKAGEMVTLIVPSTEFLPIKSGDSAIDDTISGKYMISAIGHHIVRQDGYYMGIELMKDSYTNRIADIVKVGSSPL